jgi:hypothetical protein
MLRCAVMLAMQSYGYMDAIVPALTTPAKVTRSSFTSNTS